MAMRNFSRRWRLYGNAVVHKEFAHWLWRRVWLDDIPGRAAQLSYYFLLALFPLLLLFTTALGFLVQSADLRSDLLSYLWGVVPRSAFQLVEQTIRQVSSNAGTGKISVGILGTLWAASSGMSAISDGLNAAFDIHNPPLKTPDFSRTRSDKKIR